MKIQKSRRACSSIKNQIYDISKIEFNINPHVDAENENEEKLDSRYGKDRSRGKDETKKEEGRRTGKTGTYRDRKQSERQASEEERSGTEDRRGPGEGVQEI